jgi:hypothetical protein
VKNSIELYFVCSINSAELEELSLLELALDGCAWQGERIKTRPNCGLALD